MHQNIDCSDYSVSNVGKFGPCSFVVLLSSSRWSLLQVLGCRRRDVGVVVVPDVALSVVACVRRAHDANVGLSVCK